MDTAIGEKWVKREGSGNWSDGLNGSFLSRGKRGGGVGEKEAERLYVCSVIIVYVNNH